MGPPAMVAATKEVAIGTKAQAFRKCVMVAPPSAPSTISIV